MLSEKTHLVKSHAPSADLFNGNPVGDYVNAAYAKKISWILTHKGGTTGKGTATVLCSAAAAGTSTTAVAFRYRKGVTGVTNELGATTAATAAGVQTVAGEDAIYEIEVDAASLTADKPFVALALTEDVDDPVAGCVTCVLHDVRYAGASASGVLS